MILNELKPLICSDEVVLYEEYGKPMSFEFDCCGIYYDENDNEMYHMYGDREVEAMYTDGSKLIIDINEEDLNMRIVDNMNGWEEYILTKVNPKNMDKFYNVMDGIYKICERTMYTTWDKDFCDRLVKMFSEKEIF